MSYSKPILRPLNDGDIRGQSPCWSGGGAYGGQCGNGSTAATSCATGYSPFSN
jgi:hypothetical protein